MRITSACSFRAIPNTTATRWRASSVATSHARCDGAPPPDLPANYYPAETEEPLRAHVAAHARGRRGAAFADKRDVGSASDLARGWGKGSQQLVAARSPTRKMAADGATRIADAVGRVSMSAAKVVALADFEARGGDVTAGAFRSVMRELASGVVLVTSAFERKRAGCAVSSVSSLSLEPASLLVCLRRRFLDPALHSRQWRVRREYSGRSPFCARAAFRFFERARRGPFRGGRLAFSRRRDRRACAMRWPLSNVASSGSSNTQLTPFSSAPALPFRRATAAPALVHWRSRFETLA